MAGHHTPLLQLQLPGFLSECAGGTAPTAAEIAASAALDTITLANTLATTHLNDTAQSTAEHECSVGEAVTSAGFSTFGVGVALAFEMFEAGLVLTVDDAGQPPRDETWERNG
jgi:hypothetical protein